MITAKIYKHSADHALRACEYDNYRESSEINSKCANAIDEAIRACNYDSHHYKMADAVRTVADTYGFERMNWVLAGTIHNQHFDSRYSSGNRQWARTINIPDDKYPGYTINTHPAVLDGFVSTARKVHREVMIETVGQYEKSHRMADRNRLTWFHSDFGSFVPNPGITDQRLTERYNEILEKKSVLDQIRSARKAQKSESAPKTERKKSQQKPEL